MQVYANTEARISNNGHLCGTVTGQPDGSDIPNVTTITCDVTARYVTIYQGTDNGASTALDFVEVEVFGKKILQVIKRDLENTVFTNVVCTHRFIFLL